MFNRKDAFSMEIKDPDNLNNKSRLIKSMILDDEMYTFSQNCTFKIMTAESIDPENKYPDTRHTYEKIYDLGTQSSYFSLVILQSENIIKNMGLSEKDKNTVLSHIWKANKRLINCYNSYKYIQDEFDYLSVKCDSIIEKHKNKGYIPSLPKIKELEVNFNIFFREGKLFLIETFELLSLLLNKPNIPKQAAHFNKHLEWVKSILGTESNLYNLIEADIGWIQLLSEIRNAVEHPNVDQWVKVKNISLLPNNKFTVPRYSYNLLAKEKSFINKNIKLQQTDLNLINDLHVLLYNMLHFFEDLFVLIAEEKLKDRSFLIIYKISENQINKDCPFNYDITVKPEYLKQITEGSD